MGGGKLGPEGTRYMALRLRVISDHRHRMGEKSTFVFGVSGGSIGRSAENDWVLPDDMRYVSGRHARIVFHKGRYLLQDTSSNADNCNAMIVERANGFIVSPRHPGGTSRPGRARLCS